MCRELEETGLNKPQYYVNAFMLTAIVYNNFMDLDNVASNTVFEDNKKFIAEKAPIDKKNERLVAEKAPIDKKNERLAQEKTLIDKKNERLVEGKTPIDKKNERLVAEKVPIDKKNERLVERKATFERNKWMIAKINDYYNKGNITAIIHDNLLRILTEFNNTDVIGRKEIREKLGYGDSKAARVIEKMLELRFLTTIPNVGKGKYRFKNENEEQ